MKRHSIVLSLVVFAIVFFNSCTVTKNSTSTVKTMDIYGSGVIHLPVVVELIVSDTKVSATIDSSTSSTSIENMKLAAISKAITSANADILVEPSFVIETAGYDKKVTVTGFPANYSNFRTIKPEDVELLQVGVLQVADVSETKSVSQEKSKASKPGLIAVGVAIGVALIVAIIAG